MAYLTHEEIDALNTSEAHKASLHKRLNEFNEMQRNKIAATGIRGLDTKPHKPIEG